MRTPIGLGIIGLGAMGAEMLDVAAAHPDVDVRLCADLQPESVNRAKLAHPAVSFTTSPLEVIDSEEVDAIYIATPPIFHADYAIRAMRQGKAVFCEKPLAISIADGQTMVEVARETGMVNALNFALSDRHAVIEIERALHAGEVGDVRGVDIRLLFPRWPRDFQAGAAWLEGREQGGFIREVFSHFAYLTDRLLTPITPTFTATDYPIDDPKGSEVSAWGLFHAGTVPIKVTGQTNAAVPETYEWYVYGTRRSYCFRNWSELLSSTGEQWSPVDLPANRGSEATRLSAFVRACRGQAQTNLADFAAGLRVQHLVEAFHKS